MKIIRTENEYENALKRVEAIMDLDSPNNDELDEMELLVLLIEKYEAEHYPISAPDPVKNSLDQISPLCYAVTYR